VGPERRVLRTAPRDAATFRRLSEVTQLVRSPIALFDPVVLWHVAGAWLRAAPAGPLEEPADPG
jgi:hypothetical protein